MLLQRLNSFLRLLFASRELNGWSPYTLKLIRGCEVYCGRGDEIEPQRLGGNIGNGETFAQA